MFIPLPGRKGSVSGSNDAGQGGLVRFAGNPNHLLHSFEKLTDDELLSALGLLFDGFERNDLETVNVGTLFVMCPLSPPLYFCL